MERLYTKFSRIVVILIFVCFLGFHVFPSFVLSELAIFIPMTALAIFTKVCMHYEFLAYYTFTWTFFCLIFYGNCQIREIIPMLKISSGLFREFKCSQNQIEINILSCHEVFWHNQMKFKSRHFKPVTYIVKMIWLVIS